VIRDANPDFRINPDTDVYRISPQNVVDALPCQCQSFRQVWYKSAVDCMRNANKCQKISYSAMVNKIKNWSGIHAYPDHHQELTISEGPPLAHACQVLSTSVSAFVSHPVYRMTDRTIRLVGGGNKLNGGAENALTRRCRNWGTSRNAATILSNIQWADTNGDVQHHRVPHVINL